MVRTQIILEERQRRELKRIARGQSRSMSEVVREMIDAQLRSERRRLLSEAARDLREDYLRDSELTAFTSLEGENIRDEG